MQLEIEFLDYWIAGTGEEEAGGADLTTARDPLGLPCLPGRALRGLLRDAVHELEQLGACGTGRTQALFGARGGAQSPGALRVSSARLPDELGRGIVARGLSHQLFASLRQTAIDPEAGTAAAGSLRQIEVAVPLTLRAEVELLAGHDCPGWQHTLAEALPLVRGAGRARSRGLGRLALRAAEATP
jgi:hypothetical protein